MAESKTFWLEVGGEALVESATEFKNTIIDQIPYEELYTIGGEIDRNKRWGAILYEVKQLIANLTHLGFN